MAEQTPVNTATDENISDATNTDGTTKQEQIANALKTATPEVQQKANEIISGGVQEVTGETPKPVTPEAVQPAIGAEPMSQVEQKPELTTEQAQKLEGATPAQRQQAINTFGIDQIKQAIQETQPKEKVVEDVKIKDIVPTFGYETEVAERQERNKNIAVALHDQSKSFDEKKLFDEIKMLAPGVTEEEIQNTVNDIRGKFNSLAMLDDVANIDSSVLAQNIYNGDITISDISGLKETDPAKWAEINNMVAQNNKIAERNSTLETMNSLYSDERIETSFEYMNQINMGYQEALRATDGEESLKEYQAALNDPKLLEQREKLIEKEGEIQQLDNQLNTLRSQVMEEFKGASSSLINAIIADRGAALNEQKNSLLIESQTLGASINNKVTTAQNNYDLNLQQENIERENILSSYDMTRETFDKQRDVLNRQLDKEDKEYRNNKSIEDQVNMLSLQNDYQRDFALFSKKLDNEYGGNTISYTDDNGTMHLINKTSGQEVGSYGGNTGPASETSMKALGDSAWFKGGTTNPSDLSGDTDWDIDVSVGDNIPSPISGTVKFARKDPGTGNVQVQIESENGELVTINHLDDKTLAKMKDKVGQTINIGDSIGVGGNSGNVMTTINGKGVWLRKDGKVVDAVYDGKTAQQLLDEGRGSHLDVRVISGGKSLAGDQVRDYIRTSGEGIQPQEPTPSELLYFNQGIKGIGDDKLSAYRYDEIDRMLGEKRSGGLNEDQTSLLESVDILLKKIDEGKGFDTAVGTSPQKVISNIFGEAESFGGSKGAAFEEEFKTLQARMTLPNLAQLKGSMSDNDIKFIKSAGTALSLRMGEDDFEEKLRKLQTSLLKGQSDPLSNEPQSKWDIFANGGSGEDVGYIVDVLQGRAATENTNYITNTLNN